MQELLYNAFDIAYVITQNDMGAKKATDFVNWLWQEEVPFLNQQYRYDKYKLVSDVYYWSDYLSDKIAIEKEFPAIKKDLEQSGNAASTELLLSEHFDVDLFFKVLRLRILYLNEKKFVKMKLRSLMKEYGYKRRSDKFMQYIRDCLMFYHIQTYVKGGVLCDICEVNIDEMIVFRVA